MEKAQYLYETSVSKLVQEKVPDKRVENGESVEVIRTVNSSKKFKVAVLRPDRKKYKEAEIFYAKRLSFYLKEGLLPHSLVSKRYLNDGGPLSEQEKSLVEKLRGEYVKLQEEYFSIKSPMTDEQSKRRGDIIMELSEINKTLQEIQSNYSEVFANTAEAKAKGDVTDWWILNLSYVDFEGKGLAPLFGEGDYEAKFKQLDELKAKEDKFINEIINKLSYFISFWHTAGPEITGEDFKSAEENYNTVVTQYFVEDETKKPIEEKQEGFIPQLVVVSPSEPAP